MSVYLPTLDFPISLSYSLHLVHLANMNLFTDKTMTNVVNIVPTKHQQHVSMLKLALTQCSLRVTSMVEDSPARHAEDAFPLCCSATLLPAVI